MENIEKQFLSINDFSKFPHGEDYVSKYSEARSVFNTIHREINVKMLEHEKEGYYNDHGVDHIKMVIDRASKIISVFNENENRAILLDYEVFILLNAIQLHDAGHLIAEREEHTNVVSEILNRHFKYQYSTAERKTISNIARAHGGKDDPIGKLTDDHISGIKIHDKLLAAILRLADELAEDRSRASTSLLRMEDDKRDTPNKHINKYSEIYHRYSECVDSILIEGNEIKISFCVDKYLLSKVFEKKIDGKIEEEYLINEIYSRTYKTFTETLYCNRFFPASCRFEVIKVKIEVFDDNDKLFKTISYELKERGYPYAEKQNSLIHDQIKENGHILDGEYLAQLIKNEEYEQQSV